MHDVLLVRVTRPGNVFLTRLERCAHGVHTGNEFTVRSQNVVNRIAHPGHDFHVDDNVGRIRNFDTDLSDGGTEWTHAERYDIHGPATHRTIEQSVEDALHITPAHPVIGGAGVIFVDAADESAVLDPRDITGVRACQEAVGAQIGIEADESTRTDKFLTKPIVLCLRTIAPDDMIGFDKIGHLGNPFLEGLVSNNFWNHHVLVSFDSG